MSEALEEIRERSQTVHDHLRAIAEHAKAVLGNGVLVPAGYRVLVKPIEIKQTLEHAEAQLAPTLAAKGFQGRTEQEAERQERGENHGIVMALGPLAYNRPGMDEPWCAKDDVVLYTRYAGQRVEHPPGSKNFFQIINDEDVFGKVI